jgi:hypothetical protein
LMGGQKVSYRRIYRLCHGTGQAAKP